MIAALLAMAGWRVSPALRRVLDGAALALVCAAALATWLHRHDRHLIETRDAAVTGKVMRRAAAASEAAHHAVTTATRQTEQADADARDAAERSDDPLRAGLDRLRLDHVRPADPAAR